MRFATRLLPPSISCAAALLVSLGAFAQQAFTPKGVVQWGQGGDRERGMLTQMGYGQLTQGQFGLSVADLNGDNRPEILVMQTAACDNAGCPITALQSAGQGKVLELFAQKVPGRLAITNEKLGNYNAFASADQSGAIMRDAAGRALVYPVGAGAAATASSPTPAAPPPAHAAAPPPAAAAAPAAAAPGTPVALTDRQRLVTGIGYPDWRTPGAEYMPSCLYPKCLNLQVVEKTGIGTAAAKIRGEVNRDDATRWCAIYMPVYKFCVDDQVESGGAQGGVSGPLRETISANCETGDLDGVDGFAVRYSGTWPDGPGAGRPKFASGGAASFKFEQEGMVQLGGAWTINQLARERSSGEALAIQWEMLCKGAPPPPARD